MGFSLALTLPAIAATFQIGDAVEVNWNSRWWPATLERRQNDRYCITYNGFDRRWDECVTADRIRSAPTTPEAMAQRLYQVGFQNLIQRQYIAAIDGLEKSLTLAETKNLNRIESLVIQERALNALGTAYTIVGDFNKLQTTAERYLKVAEQLQDPAAISTAISRLGSSYFYRGDFVKAASYHQQAIDRAGPLAPATKQFAIVALAETYLAQNKFSEAIALLQPVATTATEPEIKINALQTIGIAQTMQGQYPPAIDGLQQAIDLSTQNQGLIDLGILGNAVNNLGYTFYRAGDLNQAETQLRRALQIWQTQRSTVDPNQILKVSLAEGQVLSYNTLQKVLIEKNQPESALEISEQGRNQIFLEMVANRISPAAAQRVEQETVNIQRIRAIAKAQKATLVEYSLIDTKPNFSLPGQVDATELLIWVVKPTGEVSFRSVNLQQQQLSVKNLVFETRDAMNVRSRASARPVNPQAGNSVAKLRQLYDLLIAPIADQLPTDPNQRVVFIPQRELFLVPFPALLNPAGSALIEQHTILTAPSIQSLDRVQLQRPPQFPPKYLIVGNPTMPIIQSQAASKPETLSPLFGAESEAIDIAKLFQTQALTGSQAKRATVLKQMPDAEIIHLATHGLLDDFQGVGMPGAIALAPDGTGQVNDGLLNAGDLFDPALQLRAELVVLSACDTGRGRVTGDGVVGLSRSFLVAGASTVMVSLWQVPDRPTADLMRGFYQNWRQQGMDKAQALRQAMRQVKQVSPDPVNWAAFTLIGTAD